MKPRCKHHETIIATEKISQCTRMPWQTEEFAEDCLDGACTANVALHLIQPHPTPQPCPLHQKRISDSKKRRTTKKKTDTENNYAYHTIPKFHLMEAEPLSESKIQRQSPWTNLDLAVGKVARVALAAENVVLQRGRKSLSWQMGQLHANHESC